jgi:ABC-2 type transport system permease protein
MVVRRELKARYKDSRLGFLWSLLKPLTMLLIYYVAIGQFLGAARGIPDFAIFIFAGLTVWGLFAETVATGTSSIVQNSGLIKKVYFPREIFPLAAAGSALFNLSIQLCVLFAATFALGQFPLSWNLLYALAGLLIMVIYGVAAGLLLSAVNVYLRDMQYLVEVGVQVMFWMSPIVYAWSYVVDTGDRVGSWVTDFLLLNPLTTAILAFQRGTWVAGSESRTIEATDAGPERIIEAQPWPTDLGWRLAIATLVGILFLAFAQRVFARLQGNFAQEL